MDNQTTAPETLQAADDIRLAEDLLQRYQQARAELAKTLEEAERSGALRPKRDPIEI